MTYRPIGQQHSDSCFDTDEYHRCDACRRYGLPVDDRTPDVWTPGAVTYGTDHTTRKGHDREAK